MHQQTQGFTQVRGRGWRSLAIGAVAALVTAVGLAACGSDEEPQTASASTKLGFQLDFLYAGYQAPFFLAEDAGYWTKRGLDVTIREGNGSANGIKTLLGGLNQIGMFDRPTMAISAAKDPNLLAVMGIDNRGGWSIVTLSDRGVTQPSDLVGKKIATQLGGADGTLLPAFFEANGVNPDDVSIESVAPEAKTTLLQGKKVDGATYINYAQVPQIRASGLDVNTLVWSEHGLPLIGTGLVTTKSWAEDNPEAIKAFVAGAVEAFEAAEKDPTVAIDAFIKHNPKFDRGVAEEQLKVVLEALHGPGTDGKPLGFQTEDSWSGTLATLERVKLLEAPKASGEYFTNRYLPGEDG